MNDESQRESADDLWGDPDLARLREEFRNETYQPPTAEDIARTREMWDRHLKFMDWYEAQLDRLRHGQTVNGNQRTT